MGYRYHAVRNRLIEAPYSIIPQKEILDSHPDHIPDELRDIATRRQWQPKVSKKEFVYSSLNQVFFIQQVQKGNWQPSL